MTTTTAPAETAADTTTPAPAAAPTLLERAADAALLAEWVREAGEAGDLDEGALPEWLEELQALAEAPLRDKTARLGLAIKHREQDVDVIDAEIARLQARKKARENEIGRMKRYGLLCLSIAGETKVETALVTVAVRINPPGVRGALTDEQLAALRAAGSPFVRVVPPVPESLELDKKAVLAAFKDKKAIPAGLTVERSANLQVK